MYEHSGNNAPAESTAMREHGMSLEECANHGARIVSGRIAGWRFDGGARPHVIRGIRGWEIVEEILAAGYRAEERWFFLQRLFVTKLDAARTDLVMGEVADENLPSAAYRATCRRRTWEAGSWWCSMTAESNFSVAGNGTSWLVEGAEADGVGS